MVSSILIDIVIPAKILGKCLTISYKINKICHPTIPPDLPYGQLWILFYKNSDLVLYLPLSRKRMLVACHFLQNETYGHLINQRWSLRAPTHLMQALFQGGQWTHCLPTPQEDGMCFHNFMPWVCCSSLWGLWFFPWHIPILSGWVTAQSSGVLELLVPLTVWFSLHSISISP